MTARLGRSGLDAALASSNLLITVTDVVRPVPIPGIPTPPASWRLAG